MSDSSPLKYGDDTAVTTVSSDSPHASASSSTTKDFYARLQHATVCTIDDQRLIVLPVSGYPASLLDWLEQEPSGDRFYFASRDRLFRVAGSGQAHAIPSSVAMDVIDQLFDSSGQGTIVGLGLPFAWEEATDATPRNTDSSPVVRISRRLVVQIDNEIRAFLVVADDQTDDLEQEYEQFVESFRRTTTQPVSFPKLTALSERTKEQELWKSQMTRAVDFLENNTQRKIVLSRREHYRTEQTVSPIALMRSLASKQSSAFTYLLDLDSQRSIIGASPELLFRRQGDELATEAVAGTATLGTIDTLTSEKQHREQQIVVDWLRAKLEKLATDVTIEASGEELPAGSLCHRRTRFHAQLRAHQPVSGLLATLHPTPAVCGEPSTDARRMIASIETTPRGMYSGVIGVVAPGYAECAVALRIALIEPNTITLSAGAGLVVGSNAEEEWQETDQKIDQLRSLFPR